MVTEIYLFYLYNKYHDNYFASNVSVNFCILKFLENAQTSADCLSSLCKVSAVAFFYASCQYL